MHFVKPFRVKNQKKFRRFHHAHPRTPSPHPRHPRPNSIRARAHPRAFSMCSCMPRAYRARPVRPHEICIVYSKRTSPASLGSTSEKLVIASAKRRPPTSSPPQQAVSSSPSASPHTRHVRAQCELTRSTWPHCFSVHGKRNV